MANEPGGYNPNKMSDEELDSFLEDLGDEKGWAGREQTEEASPAVMAHFIVEQGSVMKADEVIPEAFKASTTADNLAKRLSVGEFPPVKDIVPAGDISISPQQKNNVCTIVYAHETQGVNYNAEVIYKAWPISGSEYQMRRAGTRPSITAIQQFLSTPEFGQLMEDRGIKVQGNPGGLTYEQIALISILGNTASRESLSTRLKKAGVSWSKFNGWKRQKPFADALKGIAGNSLQDAIPMADVQLASLAQNGDLKAIVYLNEMVGRGPNNKKAVDAVAFARIVLEAVQKNVSPEQAKAISAEIELASKTIGM